MFNPVVRFVEVPWLWRGSSRGASLDEDLAKASHALDKGHGHASHLGIV